MKIRSARIWKSASRGWNGVNPDGRPFAVNGETFESLQPHARMLELEGVEIPVLDIDGLLKAKTDYREKDVDMSEFMETHPWSKSDGLLSWTVVGQAPVLGVGRPQRPFSDSVSRFAQGS